MDEYGYFEDRNYELYHKWCLSNDMHSSKFPIRTLVRLAPYGINLVRILVRTRILVRVGLTCDERLENQAQNKRNII